MLPASKLATDERSGLASFCLHASALQPLAFTQACIIFLWANARDLSRSYGTPSFGTNLLVFIHILTKGNQAARTASSEAESSAASAAASFFTSACMR